MSRASRPGKEAPFRKGKIMNKTFYIASWRPEGGVYRVGFDPESGRITQTAQAAPGTHTSYFERDGDLLYVLSEIVGPGDLAGILESFRMTEGGLEPVDRAEGVPSGAPHLRLGNGGRTMYIASYTTGAVCSLDVTRGRFGGITTLLRHSGRGQDPVRQEGPHAHMMCPTPDGRYVVCVDLGTDELRVYAVGGDGALSPHGTVKVPAGYGPRHMVFSRDGQYAYVVCELRYRLLTYRYLGDGTFRPVGDTRIIPDLPEDQNWGGAIKLSRDGALLFTTNRGRQHSSIDVLSLRNPAGPERVGALESCAHPRDFAVFEEAGREHLVCLNMTSDNVTFYAFDRASVTFTPLDSTDAIPMPVCVI